MRLYHNPMSSCSQKVRMALAEKGLSYDDTVIDLQKGEQFAADYVALNPNAVVPTLVDGDAVLIESTLINEYIDDAYPQHALRPDSAAGRHAIRLFCKKIDDALHPACGVITFAIGARPGLLARPREEVDALIESIPSEARRTARRSVVEHGVRSPLFVGAIETHADVFGIADETLGHEAWLSGDAFGLADCALIPYVLRADHLGQGNLISGLPNLARWYDAVRARDSYEEAIGQWVPEPVVAMFNKAGAAVKDEIAEVLGG